MAIKRLIEQIIEKDSVLCVGLDPVVEKLPHHLKEEILKEGSSLKAAAQAILKFNKDIIDSICDLVAVVKPQSAYYELLGPEGVKVFEKTISYAQEKGLFVISDIKRGDIGSTSQAYAIGHLGEVDILGTKHRPFHADALTINPYLGDDSNREFYNIANDFDGMNFVLVKTSNPSSHQLQNRIAEEKPIYQHVAEAIVSSGKDLPTYRGYNNIGAVVGATYPKELQAIRNTLPQNYFLIPGYGAQGATSDDITAGFDDQGLGAIVNSSRGIIFAFDHTADENTYKLQIRKAAMKANEDLNNALRRAGKRQNHV